MSHNKLYRNFIILQEDERGYSTSKDKTLSGYAKIEAKGDKCKVSFYAQNLNPNDKYSMVLICCRKDFKQLIDLGNLKVNQLGKGDVEKEYYINNIAGLGISYEKISGAAICKIKGGETGFVMHGFMNGEEASENWRKFKLISSEDNKQESTLNVETNITQTAKVDDVDKHIIVEPQQINTEERIKIQSSDECNNQTFDQKVKDSMNIELNDIKDDDNELELRGEELKELSEEDRNKCKKAVKEEGEKEKNKNKNYKLEEHKHKECTKDKCKDEDEHEEKNKYKEKYQEEKKYKKDNCNYKKDEDYYKEDKDDNKEKYKEKKEEKKDFNDIIEQYIQKLIQNLETYDGEINFDMDLDGDFIVYGIIKDKSNNKYKWKMFKLDKHCCSKPHNFINIKGNTRRIEENTTKDSLNFERYESEIEKIKNSNNFRIKGKTGEYFENLAEDFEPYNQVLTDINYCKWYKVDVDGIEDLCNQSNYNKYTLAYYPMLNYYPYISKENYFLLGYKCNKEGELKYIVYGIPGSKDKDEQPFGGKTGFVTWTNDEIKDQGYWLMFYDYKNSSIVVPMK